MSEINKILKALNENRSEICKRVGTAPLHAEKISNAELLYGIRFLLSDAAIEMEIKVDAEKLDQEIYRPEEKVTKVSEDICERIQDSFGIDVSKYKKRMYKEFWKGAVISLFDYKCIDRDNFTSLYNMIDRF